ncbi:hypothetical protein [uncultured Megasphaera sp.]|uniref:hypothetical protein n=1 Tax=uncultured Megasphaera sp. TaxID=165188 RepID=UPI002659AD9C|nr:hypothetical protein [uncultured Megasphaera sp.]
MKRWKSTAAAVMAAGTVLLAGCGSLTMMEEYSFGYAQLKEGDSEIYLMTPFDLAHVKRQGSDAMMYVNNDKHLNVIAVSEPAGGMTAQHAAEQNVTMLEQTPDISDLQTKIAPATVSGRQAVIGEYTYKEPLNGEISDLVVRSIFFEDKGQIWHVMYMYRQGDAMGQEVTDYIFGQIQ